MPQELQVLQCYSCKTYQVVIVKKEPKWSCKMCGDKQSVKKIFHRGNAKECRLYVQELNERRIKSETMTKPENRTFVVTETEFGNKYMDKSRSKWFEFMENSEDVENTNFEDHGGLPSGCKRKLDGEESRPGRKNASEWAKPRTQPISTVKVYRVKNVENNLDVKNSIFIGKRAINSNELISIENNVKKVDHKREVTKLNNKISGESVKSKWDEFNEGRSNFDISNSKDDNELSNLTNKKYRREQLSEPEHHKISRNKSNRFNIFESENRDLDSFLDM